MASKPEDLYLDLMKKTLSFFLWPEPPLPIALFNYLRSPLRRLVVSLVSKVLGRRGLLLVRARDLSTTEREEGHLWPPGYGQTMIGRKRLDNLQSCVETILREGVEGDLIETGVWRGGACILMRAILAAHGVEDRRVFIADSFEGLPKPDAEKFPADRDDQHHRYTCLAVSQAEVESHFEQYGLLDNKVVFLKGWFRDTLPNAPIEKLAVLRLDGDMYGSTVDALTNLYPKLSKGGFCIVDDYALDGCRRAVDEYRTEHGIDAEMRSIDWTGRYWRKE